MNSSGRKKNEDADSALIHKSLPEASGGPEAVLLPRAPNGMFIYWEMNDNTRDRIRGQYGTDIFQRAQQVVRVYAVSGAGAKGLGNQICFDIQVKGDAKNWYINVPRGGGAYRCEVGLVTPEGGFLFLAGTNTVELPSGWGSDNTDGYRGSVPPGFGELLQLSGVEYIGKSPGEVAKSLAQRWEMLRSVFSRAASWGVDSLSSQAQRVPERNKFRLIADCELILYGAAVPNTFVTVSGRRVQLNPDGAFSMRFAFLDGGMHLPIEVV